MDKQASHVERIRSLDWQELRELWSAIKEQDTPEWPPGKAFEHLVLRAFEIDGADVRWPYQVSRVGSVELPKALEQIDGVVYAAGLSCLVESKDTTNEVNVEPIAKLRNQLLRRPSPAVGLLFSVAGFTSPAQVLAGFLAPQTILLWGGDDVEYCLRNERICDPLLRKYRACVEEGRPDHILEEDTQ